jgi:hypothetical protein
MKVIEVIWHDAHSEGVSGGTWFDKADISGAPYEVRTVGLWVEEVKPDHITIAQSCSMTDGLMDSVIHIPYAMVKCQREML